MNCIFACLLVSFMVAKYVKNYSVWSFDHFTKTPSNSALLSCFICCNATHIILIWHPCCFYMAYFKCTFYLSTKYITSSLICCTTQTKQILLACHLSELNPQRLKSSFTSAHKWESSQGTCFHGIIQSLHSVVSSKL